MGHKINVPKWCLYLSSSVLCDPRSTEKEQNENLFTHNCYYILKERKKNPAAYNMRITDSMCIHSQTVLLMYHLLRTT